VFFITFNGQKKNLKADLTPPGYGYQVEILMRVIQTTFFSSIYAAFEPS